MQFNRSDPHWISIVFAWPFPAKCKLWDVRRASNRVRAQRKCCLDGGHAEVARVLETSVERGAIGSIVRTGGARVPGTGSSSTHARIAFPRTNARKRSEREWSFGASDWGSALMANHRLALGGLLMMSECRWIAPPPSSCVLRMKVAEQKIATSLVFGGWVSGRAIRSLDRSPFVFSFEGFTQRVGALPSTRRPVSRSRIRSAQAWGPASRNAQRKALATATSGSI